MTKQEKAKLCVGISFVALMAYLIVYKYQRWGCILVCGDWYDE
tara:strand:+ start:2072 stop:2200 length:129 start_codon:yes stop_codon:yes gene_type:complete